MQTKPTMSRRQFIRYSAGAAAAIAFPTIIPATALAQNGRPSPNGKLRVALIGCGSRAGYAAVYPWHSRAEVVAVCDPIRARREASQAHFTQYGTCDAYADFREVLARPDVDLVHIATGDHWHVPISLMAAKAGKHMYTEKPLGLTAEQCLAARAITDKFGRKFQYGAQQRSMESVRRGIELVLNGCIGKVTAVYAWAPPGESGGSATPVLPVPDGFDYDLWLGPAPETPFCHDRCLVQSPRNGIFHIYDYAIGFMAGWGAHPMDMMQWWADNSGRAEIPVRYEGKGTLPTEGLFNTITHWDVTATFADGLPLRFMDTTTAMGLNPKPHPGIKGDPATSHGTLFVGTEGWVFVSRDGWKVFPETLYQKSRDPGDKRLIVSREQIHNLVDSILDDLTPVDDLHSAVRSDLACHLSDIAIRTGRVIQWDPKRETIRGDREAARMLSRPMREPWSLKTILHG